MTGVNASLTSGDGHKHAPERLQLSDALEKNVEKTFVLQPNVAEVGHVGVYV